MSARHRPLGPLVRAVLSSLVLLAAQLTVPPLLEAQLVGIASADSIDGQPRSSLAIGGWLKLHGVYDFSGTPYTWALSPPSIPVGEVERDPQLNLDMHQTRLSFAAAHRPDGFPGLSAYIETDFFGGGGGELRMRHAFLTIGSAPGTNILAGHTWTTFADAGAWPNVTDFDGPPTGVWVRQSQIRLEMGTGVGRLQVALETPEADFERSLQVDSLLVAVGQNVPEAAANLRWARPRGHVQLGGVLRHVRYQNRRDGEKAYFRGWGLTLSGVQRITDGGDLLTFQVLGGRGIARYMVGYGGLGVDALPDASGELRPTPTYGGYVGYQHFWSPRWSSTAVGGYSLVQNEVVEGFGDVSEGSYASANVYYRPVPPLNFAVEFLYGTHREPTLQSPQGAYGDGGRVQFVMEYAF